MVVMFHMHFNQSTRLRIVSVPSRQRGGYEQRQNKLIRKQVRERVEPCELRKRVSNVRQVKSTSSTGNAQANLLADDSVGPFKHVVSYNLRAAERSFNEEKEEITNTVPRFKPDAHPEISIPRLVFRAAWQSGRTSDIVYLALKSGYKAIDTSTQSSHQTEMLVGYGIQRAINANLLRRKDLHIQTKIKPQYSEGSDKISSETLAAQTRELVQGSLVNFDFQDQTEPYIDTLIFDVPNEDASFAVEALSILAEYVPHEILSLGVSNITDVQTLRTIVNRAKVSPILVQTRFAAETSPYHAEMRAFCRENGMLYQASWLRNGELLKSVPVFALATRLWRMNIVDSEAAGRALALKAFIMIGLEGMSVLSVQSQKRKMLEDIDGMREIITHVNEAGDWNHDWKTWMRDIRALIGDTKL